MATFVLVHGAFHGGWCYSRVAVRLRARMHEVYTPTLSGLGDRAHLAGHPINLATHVQDVAALIESYNLNDVILCGHSYAGMVITGVAGEVGERIRTLVSLDAGVPESGQSALDLMDPDRVLKVLDTAGEGGTMMTPPGAAFFQVNSADIEWVDRMCTSHPLACFVQKLHHTGKESLVPRRTFVLCERWRSINHSTYAKVKDRLGWKAISIDCGHEVMIDNPDLLAQLLLDEAQ